MGRGRPPERRSLPFRNAAGSCLLPPPITAGTGNQLSTQHPGMERHLTRVSIHVALPASTNTLHQLATPTPQTAWTNSLESPEGKRVNKGRGRGGAACLELWLPATDQTPGAEEAL